MNSTSEQDHITLRRTFERPHYPISNNLTKISTKHFMGINQVTNFLVQSSKKKEWSKRAVLISCRKKWNWEEDDDDDDDINTLLEPFVLSQLTEAWISLTAPCQSRPSIKCWASATSKPTFPRYKLNKWYIPWIQLAFVKRERERFIYGYILWNKGLESRAKLGDFDSMVLDLEIDTPPLLKYNNTRSIFFPDNICIKCLVTQSNNKYQPFCNEITDWQPKSKFLKKKKKQRLTNWQYRLSGFGFSWKVETQIRPLHELESVNRRWRRDFYWRRRRFWKLMMMSLRSLCLRTVTYSLLLFSPLIITLHSAPLGFFFFFMNLTLFPIFLC